MERSEGHQAREAERLLKNGLSAKVSFRFSRAEYDYLTEIADKNGCTISQVIRAILFGDNETKARFQVQNKQGKDKNTRDRKSVV